MYHIICTLSIDEPQKILHSPERLQWFERELLSILNSLQTPCAAWCVLPNHYHLLVQIDDVKAFAQALGQLHGRTSFQMNAEDDARGRHVWYRCQDRWMRSEAHFHASLNYIHYNPVKHGYVTKWQDWLFSSLHWYLETQGRDWLVDLWRRYPLLHYGDKWDNF